jgi:hypothetical protein
VDATSRREVEKVSGVKRFERYIGVTHIRVAGENTNVTRKGATSKVKGKLLARTIIGTCKSG